MSPTRDTDRADAAAEHAVHRRSVAADAAARRHADQPAQQRSASRRRPAPASRSRTIATGAERKVAVPADARIGGVEFSPDGKRIAFTNTRDTAIDLYIADVATGQSRHRRRRRAQRADRLVRLARRQLRAALRLRPGRPRRGAGGAEGAGRPEHPGELRQAGPVRTYQDLLTSAHDEALFEYYMQTQLATRRCGDRQA